MAYIGAGITRFNTADELTVTGDAQIDTTTLVVDSTNNRVGVGTASPATALDVTGTVTADGLTVEGSTTPTINIKSTDAVVVADDVVGAITFEESDATGGTGVQAFIKAIANDSGNTYDMSIGVGGNTEAIRVDQSGNVGIGTSSPSKPLHVSLPTGSGATPRATAVAVIDGNDNTQLDILGGTGSILGINFGDSSDNDQARITCNTTSGSENMVFTVDAAERMRIENDGKILVGRTSDALANFGMTINGAGHIEITRDNAHLLTLNRRNGDGSLIIFAQDNATEGNITVAGSTVSLTGGHLARWSRLTSGDRDAALVKGTVMTNLDQMVVWSHDAVEAQDAVLDDDGNVVTEAVEARDAYTEDNEQLNCTAISSVEGDANVAGVFVCWDEDDDFNDMHIAQTGDMVIRIASGTTVSRGDLLMSAGDGTAKPQGDDIVRSKTIAKVTSTTFSHTYDDGTFLVPCVLMAC